jgi:AcrR family transcriptional regulator
MWDQAAIKLPAGPHGLDPLHVEQVQRERLLAAMAEVVAQVGYQDTTVRKLLAHARISRITYYELFKDKEECFLAAYDEAAAEALRRIEDSCAAMSDAPPAQQLGTAIAAALEFLAGEPAVARLVVVEVLAAGPAARERRAATMDRLAELMERFLAVASPPGRQLGPIGARALVGGAEEVVYGAIERGDTAALPRLAGQIAETQLKLVNG